MKKIDSNFETGFNYIMAGIDKVADAIKGGLGPTGKNVMLDKKFQTPQIINDGVNFLKDFNLEDERENIGVEIAKEVGKKTTEVAGDGSKTAVILMRAIVHNGFTKVVAGVNPIVLCRGIEKASALAIDEILKSAKGVNSSEELKRIAIISSGEEEFGQLVVDALEKVDDPNGIAIENSQTHHSFLAIQEGFSFDCGYISGSMINDSTLDQCIYENADILVADKKFSAFNEIFPVLELALHRKKPLLLICDDLTDEALKIVNLNNKKGVFQIVAVKAPTHGENRRRELMDIEALVGGHAFVGESVALIENIDENVLGQAQRIIIKKNQTIIIHGNMDKEKVSGRIRSIYDEMKVYESEFTRSVCQMRLRRLAGNTIIIKVGADTESEYEEKKLRIETALRAVVAAKESGIVCGGGTAYIRAMEKMQGLCFQREEEKYGVDIIRDALKTPLGQIAKNAGKESTTVIEHVMHFSANMGYNALTDRYENLYEAGIIEPALVTAVALKNAVSAAIMMLTTAVVITDEG